MAGTLKVDPPAGGGPLSDAPDDPAARVGSIVAGRYALRRVLGAGGMGAVYEAENAVTGRRVALKVMLPRAATVDTAPERFLREARAASRVAHPNIVDVLDAGQSPDGGWYIVQELLEGRELRAELEARAPLPWPEALALLGPVVEGLAAAHRQGIVHRDVKPENIFLAHANGATVPKLIDFGIARLVDGDGPLHLTRSGALLGTPNYMAPEQARGLKDLDARVDVWAMGVVFREALTGERPFHGDNYNALMIAILSAPLPPIAGLCPGLPPHAAAALDRALARDRDARFRDAGELLDALRAHPPDAFAQTAPGVSVPRLRDSRPARAAGYAAGAAAIAAVAFTLGTRAPARRALPPANLATPAVLRAPTPTAPPAPIPAPTPIAPSAPTPVAAPDVTQPTPARQAAAIVARPRWRRPPRRPPAPARPPEQAAAQAPATAGGILRGLHDR